MRTKGASTKKECYNLNVITDGEIVLNKNFNTLQHIADELGFTYNRVVEIKRGRKKQLSGKYEPKYKIIKLVLIEDIEEE